MKRTVIFAVGLLFLLGGIFSSNGQSPAVKTIATREKLSAYEESREILRFNALTKKETFSKRSKIRSKTPKFSGRWTGKLYQPEGTLRHEFNFSLRLYRRGKKVFGSSRIAISDSPQYYGVMRLRGTVKKNRLSFTEVKVTRENLAPDSRWCIKSGTLKLSFAKGKMRLKGNWKGPDCVPGTIVLRKISRK